SRYILSHCGDLIIQIIDCLFHGSHHGLRPRRRGAQRENGEPETRLASLTGVAGFAIRGEFANALETRPLFDTFV
ncbi:MAG: hypothetical protein QF805_15020, partial [Pirellulaceae bacterium]|nr:hypothetical protein [Pirellulaceae bacterium]